MVTLRKLVDYLDGFLKTSDFSNDGSNNGLQVEASTEVTKVGFAVDGSLESFKQASYLGCDLLIVHHGISWGGSLKRIVGVDAKRIKLLFDNNLSLYASHLPLDANGTLGHNAIMSAQLELTEVEPFAEYAGYKIGFKGKLPEVLTLEQLKNKLNVILNTQCASIGSGDLIRSIGVVSGGAADAITEAGREGLDALVTGEFVHQHVHLVQELGIPLIAAGHYKTEVPGIKGLQKLVEEEFEVETLFIDLPTGY